jgi:RND superfamily putative drug exporter
MKTLGDLCYRRRRLVLGGWVVLLIILFVLSDALAGEYKTEFNLPGYESQDAIDLVERRGALERTGIFPAQIVFRADQGIDDPQVRRTMETLFGDIEGAVEGIQVLSPYDAHNAYQIAEGRRLAYAELNIPDRPYEQYLDDAAAIKAVWQEVELPGLQVELGGDLFAQEAFSGAELAGLLAAVIILLVAFGSVLAMGLPIATALFGIAAGVALIGLLTRVMAVPTDTDTVAIMVGIGVGIDYALLIVSRYRAGLHDGLEPREAVMLALDTSGRAVLFAGTTVVISLLGMYILQIDFFISLAAAVVAAVLMTMLATLTLMPALLGFVGRNIDRFGLPHRAARAEGSAATAFWYRWSRLVQRRPWPALLLGGGVLIALMLPLFFIRLGFGDEGNLPESDTARRAYDLLGQGFGPGFNGQILVVADTLNGGGDAVSLAALHDAIEATPGVASATDPQPLAGGLHLLIVFPASAPQDSETDDLVRKLREETIPPVASETGPRVLVSGEPAFVVDFSALTASRLPIFIAAVLLLSFLLLMTVFHSVVVPLKAVVMNLFSIGAAFGAMVAVFQWGFGAELLGIGREGPIDAWAPLFIFAIVYGLSMDYEVFLLTRMREEYDRNGGDNASAVADGLAATGRVISAAALIMVCVFGGFVLSELRDIKLLGFGLAFAIFIDATIVRLVVVPSLMELMGRANWWAPSWLVRLLPTLRFEAGTGTRASSAAEATAGDS